MNNRVIVFFGVANSGKNTCADIVQKAYGQGCQQLAFADPIKDMAAEMYDWDRERLWGPSKNREAMDTRYAFSGTCPSCGQDCVYRSYEDQLKRWYCQWCTETYPEFLTARLVCRVLGTEAGRRLYSQTWVDLAFRRIAAMSNQHVTEPITQIMRPGPSRFIITDGRFLNELEGSQAHGGYCIKLRRGISESTAVHPSEAEFRSIPDSAFNAVLDNRIALEELPLLLDEVIKDAERFLDQYRSTLESYDL